MAPIPSAIAASLGPDMRDQVPGAPVAEFVVAPDTSEAAAEALRAASAHGLRTVVWGGGSKQAMGYPIEVDLIVSTHRMNRILDWQAEDLTIVAEAGVSVAELEAHVAERSQTAVLPEMPGAATVGGVVAAGASAWRRLRYGPTRDRVLEVVMVTGDGRTVTGGGRVVKNVTGYDVPRLATGSFGSLGMITQICFKLWPVARHAGTIAVDDAVAARNVAYRPFAMIETEVGTNVYVAGTAEEVAGQAADLEGTVTPGLQWPQPLTAAWQPDIRVPAAEVAEAVVRTRRAFPDASFQAAHGVGHVKVGVDDLDLSAFGALRSWTESVTGSLVVTARPDHAGDIEPWGTPPPSLELQRRVKAAFDPAGVMAPGRLPGGL